MEPQPLSPGPGFLARLILAFFVPWKILFDRAFAEQVEQLAGGEPASALPPAGRPLIAHHHLEEAEATREAEAREPEPEPEEAPPPRRETDPTGALLILGLLQRDGRLLDFLQEDIAGASDVDIGAAARVVHEGCRRALFEYVKLEPVVEKEEGDPMEVEPGFDAGKLRLTGNVVGKPPYKGRLAHPGWKASSLNLPILSDGVDPTIVAPAEVEI